MNFAKTFTFGTRVFVLSFGIAMSGFVGSITDVRAASTEEIRQAISGKSGTWHYRQRTGTIRYTSSSFSGSGGLQGTWKAENKKYCFNRKHPNPESSCVSAKVKSNGDIRLGNGVTLKLK